jgi:hypothetical protein
MNIDEYGHVCLGSFRFYPSTLCPFCEGLVTLVTPRNRMASLQAEVDRLTLELKVEREARVAWLRFGSDP